jgi:hypothetical protein
MALLPPFAQPIPDSTSLYAPWLRAAQRLPRAWASCQVASHCQSFAPGSRPQQTAKMMTCSTRRIRQRRMMRRDPYGETTPAGTSVLSVSVSEQSLTRALLERSLGLGAKFLSHKKAQALFDPATRRLERQLGASRAKRLDADRDGGGGEAPWLGAGGKAGTAGPGREHGRREAADEVRLPLFRPPCVWKWADQRPWHTSIGRQRRGREVHSHS